MSTRLAVSAARLVAVAGAVCLAAPVAASDVALSQAVATTPGATGVAAPDVATLLLNLGLVVAVILVFGWLWARGRRLAGGTRQGISIVASQHLGGRERLLIVQAGEAQVLVGVTANSIRHLHTLAEPVAPAASGVTATSFAEKLRQLRGTTVSGES